LIVFAAIFYNRSHHIEYTHSDSGCDRYGEHPFDIEDAGGYHYKAEYQQYKQHPGRARRHRKDTKDNLFYKIERSESVILTLVNPF